MTAGRFGNVTGCQAHDDLAVDNAVVRPRHLFRLAIGIAAVASLMVVLVHS